MPMDQREIDEISQAFQQAWDEIFGMYTYVLKHEPTTTEHPLYDERIGKPYSDPIGPIPATFRVNPTQEEIEQAGLSADVSGILTYVTKDLRDNGILSLNLTDRIRIEDRDGNVTVYEVTELSPRVQFGNNYIFTKVGVKELGGS